MRQASWNEMFAPRRESQVMLADVPEEPKGWRRFFWWEYLLTFGLLAVMMLTVAGSVQNAGWVDGMPSLLPIALLGLVMGAVLARVRWPEGFIHLLALPIGAAATLGMILSVISGATPWDRYNELQDRMHDWFRVAFTGGISNDDLPFIVLVVSLTWLAAYASAWAIFRWRNVWLALVPGGGLLLMNISYQPGQFSFGFLVFLLGAVLLVTRLHLMERAQQWRQQHTPYPQYLSLSVLHATFWLALLLMALAWFLPQANESATLESLWQRATAPISERTGELGRLFVSVNGQQSGRVHSFDDFLPFLGSIELPDTIALEVTTEALSEQGFLRAQHYDIYTPAGWKRRSQVHSSLPRLVITGVDEGLRDREPVTIQLVASGRTGDLVFTVGQPRSLGLSATIEFATVSEDVSAVRANRRLARGDVYQTTGSISIATDEALRTAGSAYPSWVVPSYLQLPDDFSALVAGLAANLTTPALTAYDKAVALESYLRTIPYDLNIPDTPRNRDAVEYFLFEAQRGYFDYHASAMVVMLRSVGVPARLAVGYALRPDDKSTIANVYSVPESSAYAWPEVYFPGFGWVEFNPTPGLATISRSSPEPITSTDAEQNPAPALGLGFENLEELFEEDAPTEEEIVVGGSSRDYTRGIAIGLAAALAVALVAGSGGLGYAWLRGLGGLAPPARRWAQTLRLASWARVPPAASRTPREYAQELREQVPDLADVDVLADAYVRHRFGGQETTPVEDERQDAAWRTVRRRLLARLLRLR